MADKRHAEDTYFIVAEADHRFYKADCIPPEEWLEVALGKHHGHEESVAAASEAKESSAGEPAAASSSSSTRTNLKKEARGSSCRAFRRPAAEVWCMDSRPQAYVAQTRG